MRFYIVVFALGLSSCQSFHEGYQKGYDRGFMNNCVKSAVEKGAPEARAKKYCECALDRVHKGDKVEDAVKRCL